MKKRLTFLLALFMLASCGSSSQSSQSSESSTSTPPSSSSEEGPRQVKTYIDWNFNNLAVGDSIPNTASEGAGFEAYRKDASNEVWVRSKNPRDWAAMYFGTPDPVEGGEIFLKNFALTSQAMLPSITASDGLSNDGGFPLLVGATGRYDAAIFFGEESSSVNLWHAGNTDGGPVATTQHNESWGDRGSKAEIVNLYQDVLYTFTVAGKYEGMNDDGDEYFTLFVFVNDRLVIQKSGIAYWTGGFGIRGWQSAVEYKNIKVTDFPLVCPDGINHFDGAAGGDYEPTKLATPTPSLANEKLTWAAVEHAAYYSIYNGTTAIGRAELLEYDLADLAAGDYQLAVRAMSNQNRYIHSDLSTKIDHHVAGAVVLKTYLNWNFDDLAANADMPYVANDPHGYKVVAAHDKKWVQTKEKAGWSAVFFGVSDQGSEVFLTSASYKLTLRNPNNEAGEGGVCMMVGGAGRYDIGVYMDGGNSSINVWEAGNTDNGPVATTQNNPSWGDRGSQVASLNLANQTDTNLQIIYKASTTEMNKFTIYVFVDNVLVIQKADLNAKSGGFGLRSFNGEFLYTNLLITDAPAKGPDGVTNIA